MKAVRVSRQLLTRAYVYIYDIIYTKPQLYIYYRKL